MKKALRNLFFVVVLVFIGIQFIPVNKTNPPVQVEPSWNSPRTKELFTRACADCHSNETVWPWYSKIYPVSAWVAGHVNEGREHFNINEKGFGEYDEAAEAVEEGWMPLESYLPMHPEAKLTPEEKNELAAGLKATFGED
ncbi:MAG: heme-binding domain-containing protein [Puniceicoccales bacterium]